MLRDGMDIRGRVRGLYMLSKLRAIRHAVIHRLDPQMGFDLVRLASFITSRVLWQTNKATKENSRMPRYEVVR